MFGNFSLFKTPFPGRNSVPPSFVSFIVFNIFSYLLSRSWVAFLGAWCPLPAFRSCFVEFTRRLNALLMNLWGKKCSPRPTPPPSWLLLSPSHILVVVINFMNYFLSTTAEGFVPSHASLKNNKHLRGKAPRWWRSRTGKTLSPPQIHQKSI